jgi:hypothetical protein
VINFNYGMLMIEHRLKPKTVGYHYTEKFRLEDNDIEVEYQGKLSEIRFRDSTERLYAAEQKTACLAEDQCGIPQENKKRKLSKNPSQTNNLLRWRLLLIKYTL